MTSIRVRAMVTQPRLGGRTERRAMWYSALSYKRESCRVRKASCLLYISRNVRPCTATIYTGHISSEQPISSQHTCHHIRHPRPTLLPVALLSSSLLALLVWVEPPRVLNVAR